MGRRWYTKCHKCGRPLGWFKSSSGMGYWRHIGDRSNAQVCDGAKLKTAKEHSHHVRG